MSACTLASIPSKTLLLLEMLPSGPKSELVRLCRPGREELLAEALASKLDLPAGTVCAVDDHRDAIEGMASLRRFLRDFELDRG